MNNLSDAVIYIMMHFKCSHTSVSSYVCYCSSPLSDNVIPGLEVTKGKGQFRHKVFGSCSSNTYGFIFKVNVEYFQSFNHIQHERVMRVLQWWMTHYRCSRLKGVNPHRFHAPLAVQQKRAFSKQIAFLKKTTVLDCLNKTLYFKECLALEKLMEK